jgi:transposase
MDLPLFSKWPIEVKMILREIFLNMGDKMKEISTIGLDLAKTVFQVHCNDSSGKRLISKKLRRGEVINFFSNLKPCLVGMEACSSAHYWARTLRSMGHEVKLIPAQYVKPFIKTNKNDANDAEAIAEAVVRPSMRFIPIKDSQHHDMQSLHRVRERFVRSKIALTNELHGLLMEYGIAMPCSFSKLTKAVAELLDPEDTTLSAFAKETFGLLLTELKRSEEHIVQLEKRMRLFANENEVCKKLQKIPGVGVVTATALVGSVVNPKNFKNGRQFAAWIGLVPRQSSSGGKTNLLSISKRGDAYLRRMLIHGGRAVVRTADGKVDRLNCWAKEKHKSRGANRASVAVANKNARIIWKLMTTEENYKEQLKAA